MKSKRREFIKTAAAASTGALVFGCTSDEKPVGANVNFNKTYEWKMITAWPPNFPILGKGADELAANIESMSGGRIKIKVYGGGELVPPLETFDAVSQGVAEMGHCASYYWAGKAPAAQFFTSLPFGMNTTQMNAWFFQGGGLELWHETYQPFNLIAFPSGNTGAQMGGWYNKEINSINDLQGLKMRFPGIGGKVLNSAGGTAVLSAGSEIYTNLERGVIDATDWIGPYHDYMMGFHEIAKYYYYPSWAEPTGVVETLINKNVFDSLPADLKEIIKEACYSANISMLGKFTEKNSEYLSKIENESNVVMKRFTDSFMKEMKLFAERVIKEITANDQMSAKVYKSYNEFQKKTQPWVDISTGLQNYSL